MTRRCRIGCNNLRGDTDVVCRACWQRLPFEVRQGVADARIGTLAARIAARAAYDWLWANPEPMPPQLSDLDHDWATTMAIGDRDAVPMPGERP